MYSKEISQVQPTLERLIANQEENIRSRNTIEFRYNSISSETLKAVLEHFKGRHDVVNIYIRNNEAIHDLIEIAKEMINANNNIVYLDIEEVCDLGVGHRRAKVFGIVNEFFNSLTISDSYSDMHGHIKYRYAIARTIIVSRNLNAEEVVKQFQALSDTVWKTNALSISLVCKAQFSAVFSINQDVVNMIMSYIEFEDINHVAVRVL